MKKNITLIIKYNIFILLIAILNPTIVLAQSTTPQDFKGILPETLIVQTSSGTLSANINVDTGIFNNAIQPVFKISSNKEDGKYLTQSWTCNTTGAVQNAIFTYNSRTYVILTNANVPPDVSSISSIKTGSSTSSNNPNAIAYEINAPPGIADKMDVSFESGTNTWKLRLLKNNTNFTSQTIPVKAPLSGTFSLDDEPGIYQATVTLSFDPS